MPGQDERWLESTQPLLRVAHSVRFLFNLIGLPFTSVADGFSLAFRTFFGRLSSRGAVRTIFHPFCFGIGFGAGQVGFFFDYIGLLLDNFFLLCLAGDE